MRRRLAVLVVIVGLFIGMMGFTGCAGMTQNVPANIATDIAFVMALEKYPAIKPAVVAALKEIKVILQGQLTYDALVQELIKRFDPKYKYIYLIVSAYIDLSKPVSTSWLNMSDAVKAEITWKIDRLLLLAT